MNGESRTHVFLAKPEALLRAGGREAAGRIVDAEDHAHIARFRFPADREIALASRLLQRLAIARFASLPQQQAGRLRFSSQAGKRPVLLEPASLQHLAFSAANTRGLVACAVSSTEEVGLDVEQVQATLAPELLAHCCTRQEQDALAAFPDELRRLLFFQLWTLKESYLKARGIGLQLSPHLIGFDMGKPGDPITLHAARDVEPDPDHWRFQLLYTDDQHVAAVCVHRARAGDASTVVVWQAQWDGQDFALTQVDG